VIARRYAIDTNLYVDALRSPEGAVALEAFFRANAPAIYLSAVVAQELLAGARIDEAADVEGAFIEGVERRGRVFAPSFRAWTEAGKALAKLVGKSDWKSLPRSFVNDVLLALSCRESGVVLVTANVRDFERIAKVKKFDFVPPWP
jgi:predicted nucleic acid-binding protein